MRFERVEGRRDCRGKLECRMHGSRMLTGKGKLDSMLYGDCRSSARGTELRQAIRIARAASHKITGLSRTDDAASGLGERLTLSLGGRQSDGMGNGRWTRAMSPPPSPPSPPRFDSNFSHSDLAGLHLRRRRRRRRLQEIPYLAVRHLGPCRSRCLSVGGGRIALSVHQSVDIIAFERLNKTC